MWNFLVGTVCGVVLRFPTSGTTFHCPTGLSCLTPSRRASNAAVVDDALIDPDIPEATRRRALEVYFANQGNAPAALEAELGYPLTRAMQNRRVKRAAQRLRAEWSKYDETLRQPALREAMSRKHGVSDDDVLETAHADGRVAGKADVGKVVESPIAHAIDLERF